MRYTAEDLIAFGRALLVAHGTPADRAQTIAEVLVEADLMGHDTHGLALLPTYLKDLDSGLMLPDGEPVVVADRGAVAVWDGQWLSGVWLTVEALRVAAERARQFGIGAVTIRRSHHIACLQAYLPRITGQGLMAIITCSDPAVASVAPHGGLDPVFTPDPIAVGIPTDGMPILIDMSASITTNGMTNRLAGEKREMRGAWVQDADGVASRDPAVLFAERPGTLLPTGGQDHGHKGYGLALTIEALSQGLSGTGRQMAEKRWGAAVFVEVFDPEMFAGRAPLEAAMGYVAARCRGSRPHPDFEAVRLPGEQALKRKAKALAEGVALYPGILERLGPVAEARGVAVPTALA